MATSKKATAKTKSSGSKKPTAKASPSGTKKKNITENDIRKRAEKIYNDRIAKGIPGDSESDWLQAERELKGSK